MAEGTRLTDMEIEEVSLVTTPANQLADVVLYKSADHGGPSMSEATSTEDEVVEYIESLEKANEELTARVDQLTEELTKAKDSMTEDEESEDEDEMEKLLKGADPRLAEIVRKSQEEAAAAQMIARAERDERLRKEWGEKVGTDLDSLPTGEGFVEVIKTVSESLPEDQFDQLWSVLTGANEMAKTGVVEIGTSTTSEVGATAVEKAAAKLRAENPELTQAQAIVKAVEANPDLYLQHMKGE
jgi:hypothetical protein